MAREYRGKVADQYEQHIVELTFTDDEMKRWGEDGPLPWAENRIAELCALHRVVYKRNKQLTDVTLATWWVNVEGALRQLLRIYPQNFNPGLPVVMDEEMGIGALPDVKSAEGKRLTLAARALDDQEWDWVHAQHGTAVEALNWIATMQSRQSEQWGWDRTKNSNGNKLMNKLHGHELKYWQRLIINLKTRQDRS